MTRKKRVKIPLFKGYVFVRIDRAAGGELINIGTNKPLEYNKEDLLNPKFIAGNTKIIQSLKR